MATFAKPENALKRAEELMNVGQKAAALQSLHDLITSKRYRTWQKPLERIMLKYVELCVDMRKGRFAKDGLIQYRIACQQVNVQSLEEVVKYFLKLATEKAEQAQAQVEAAAAEAALGEVADLEAEKSPEDLMLGFVSGEKGKERTDSELVTPWFKFLWEAYRTVLDVLRNNCKMEALYAMTAHRAFGFCQQYKRTNEFRRLCEILRNHLVNLNKYRDQRDRPDLALPETLQLYLDTRFEQLKVATELGLWQEAFRSVEDIHGLMLLSKKAPKPQLMAVYYARLTRIFTMAAGEGDSEGTGGSSSGGAASGSARLYHAYAWYKLYLLQRSYNKNLKDKDLQLLASAVVLSALAVPPYERFAGGAGAGGRGGAEGELAREKAVRMANLLGVVVDPKKDPRQMTAKGVLAFVLPQVRELRHLVEVDFLPLTAKGVLAFVLPQVRELHHLVEVDFLPLDLAARVHPLLQRLPELSDVKLSAASPVPKVELQAYTPALQRLATLRVVQQASQVYDVMTITSLCRMVPFGDLVFVERVLAEAVAEGFVHVRLDFCEGTVKFGADVSVQRGSGVNEDRVRNHLATMARHLATMARHLATMARHLATMARHLHRAVALTCRLHCPSPFGSPCFFLDRSSSRIAFATTSPPWPAISTAPWHSPAGSTVPLPSALPELESDRIRNHLATMARHLHRAVALIRLKAPAPVEEAAEQLPPAEEIQAAVEKEHRRLIARKTLIERRKEEAEREVIEKAAVEKEHRRLIARKTLIERRKEEAEREVIEKEREEQTAKLKQQRLTEEAEAKRLAAESARREEERIRREIEAKELEEARQLLLEAEKRKGKKGKKNLESVMGKGVEGGAHLSGDDAAGQAAADGEEWRRVSWPTRIPMPFLPPPTPSSLLVCRPPCPQQDTMRLDKRQLMEQRRRDTMRLDKRQLMEEALSEQLKEKQEAERRLQKLVRGNVVLCFALTGCASLLSEQLKEKQEAERRLQKLVSERECGGGCVDGVHARTPRESTRGGGEAAAGGECFFPILLLPRLIPPNLPSIFSCVQVRTLDHLERARREEEKPLLESAYQQRLVEERAWFEQQQAEAAAQSKTQHEQDLAEKIRLSRMLGDKEEFQEQVVGRRRGEFERLKREREEKLAELRELRRTERVMLRKREMFRRQEEAKALKAWEETERRKREELERKRKEEEERLKKLEEMAAKQRQREQEAEEKARKEREDLLAAAAERKTSAFVPPALRARGGGSAAGEAPPSGRVGAEEDRWSRDRAPAAAAAASATGAPGKYVPPVRGSAGGAGAGGAGDRWGGDRGREVEDRRPAGRYEPPSRSAAASGSVGERERERPSAPAAAAAAPPAAAPAEAVPAAKKWVPPHLRNRG
ncbi:unnamed protein product [Closterium sp. NIES-64]|nr:unnamed protein product [Closterium sp. NIES-64]